MKKILVLVVASLTLISCDLDNNDCGDCLTPPRQFNFDFADKDTDENLFINDTFEEDDLKVYDENDEEIEFQLVPYNDRKILVLNTIGWELDPKTYTVELSDDVLVIFDLDMDKIQGECCTYFEVKNFSLPDYEYAESPSTGIIQVKI